MPRPQRFRPGREPFDSWHKKGFDRHIVQTGRKRDPNLPDTPTLYELMDQYKTPELSRRAVQVILAGEALIKEAMSQPKEVNERVKKLLGN